MGVNAHINHDLILVIADMLQDDWAAMSPELRAQRYRDHCTVNVVIGETIDTVQEQVVEPYARMMELVDVLCGPLDEWCTARLIRNWRDDVWRSALTIVETPDAAARQDLRRAMDTQALGRIRLLAEGGAVGARVFGYPLRWLNRLRLV